MLLSLARFALRSSIKLQGAAAPATQAFVNPYASSSRCLGSFPYAVDAPDGDHDLEDIEEHMKGVQRIIDVASVTEDADAITEMHIAVFGGKKLFAVDAPDGEHDLEDLEEHLLGVDRIINSASALEDPLEVKHEQDLKEQIRMKHEDRMFRNSKY